jgi:hypothetical protein
MVTINFNIIKQPKKDYKNLLSCVFFAMKVSYRDFSKYENYLISFCENAQKFDNYLIRIYVDKSTKDNKILHEMADKYDNIEIVEYICNEFLMEGFHNGTFGTLVRLYPLFDKNDKHEIIRIMDLDMVESYFLDKEENKMNKYNLDYFFLTFIGYFKEWVNPEVYTNMAAGFIISKIKFPLDIFNGYLEELYINDPKSKTIKMINKIREETQFKYKETNNYLPYGIDELFLNYYIYPYITKNKIPYGMRAELFPSQFFNYIKYNAEISEKELDKINKLNKYLMFNYYGNNYHYKKNIIAFFSLIEQYVGKIDSRFDDLVFKAKKYKNYFYDSFTIFLLPTGKLLNSVNP